jgi:hypothetical protein
MLKKTAPIFALFLLMSAAGWMRSRGIEEARTPAQAPEPWVAALRAETAGRCSPQVESILAEVERLDRARVNFLSGCSRRQYGTQSLITLSNDISLALVDIQRKTPDCYPDAAYAYLRVSLECSASGEFAGSFAKWLRSQKRLVAIPPALWTTDAGSASSCTGRPSTGAVNGRDRSQWPKRIVGGYRCTDTTVLYNPSQTIYDLAGLALHEFDHLARDTSPDRPVPGLTVDEELLLDEVLSTLQAGFAELGPNDERSELASGRIRALNAVAAGGSIEGLLNLARKDRPPSASPLTALEFLAASLPGSRQGSRAEARELFKKLVAHIESYYFSCETTRTDSLIRKLESAHVPAIRLDPFAAAISSSDSFTGFTHTVEQGLADPVHQRWSKQCEDQIKAANGPGLRNYIGKPAEGLIFGGDAGVKGGILVEASVQSGQAP